MNEAKIKLQNEAPFIFKDNKSVKRSELHSKVTHIAIDFFNEALMKKIVISIWQYTTLRYSNHTLLFGFNLEAISFSQ
ncbi:hypothetical protein JW960_22005 [candidate division KSB1 bacterium]|nr:hypothetical protein [candidate division KSB1 bacterium]